jgi:hypothetical protein
MNSIRCSSCSFLNFASAETCKRCGSPLGVANGAEWEQHGYPQPNGGAFDSQSYAPYQPYYSHSSVASNSRGKGGWVVVIAILVLLAIVAVPFVMRNKKTSASSMSWYDYHAPDGSFSISVPTTPKEMNMSQPTPAGTIQMHILQAEVNKDAAGMVLYADFPTTSQPPPLNLIAEQMVQKMADGNKMFTISSWRNISIGSYQGIEFDLKTSPSSPVSGSGGCRLYWVPPRMYVMAIGGSDSVDVAAMKARFFDSFKLLK